PNSFIDDSFTSRPLLELSTIDLSKYLYPKPVVKPLIHSKLNDHIKAHLTLSNFKYSTIKYSSTAISWKTILGIGGLLGRIPLIRISTDFQPQIPALG